MLLVTGFLVIVIPCREFWPSLELVVRDMSYGQLSIAFLSDTDYNLTKTLGIYKSVIRPKCC